MNVAIFYFQKQFLGAKLRAFWVCCILNHWLKVDLQYVLSLVLLFKIQVSKGDQFTCALERECVSLQE